MKMSPPNNESPLSEHSTNPSFRDNTSKGDDGEMLRITPQDAVHFTRTTKLGTTEYHATVEISNIATKSILYKVRCFVFMHLIE